MFLFAPVHNCYFTVFSSYKSRVKLNLNNNVSQKILRANYSDMASLALKYAQQLHVLYK